MALRRKTPLRKKRPTPRRSRAIRCIVIRCKRRGEISIGLVSLCRSHAKVEADRLAGSLVRDRGQCEFCGTRVGPFNWAHGFSRRYLAIRWDLRNGFCLCRPCDFRMTHHPLGWDEFIRGRMGDSYEVMRMAGLTASSPPDYAAIISELRTRTAYIPP